jgi:acyl dehydratase
MALLTDELRRWIGREVHYPAREAIGRASLRYFALAIGEDDPLYYDDAYAARAGYRSAIAPPTFVVESCQYAHQAPDADGYIGHEWRLPLAGCRLIRAGNDYEFHQPVYPDDEVSVTFRLEHIEERARRRGGSQLFVTALATYRNQRGELLATNREVTVVQPIESGEGAP